MQRWRLAPVRSLWLWLCLAGTFFQPSTTLARQSGAITIVVRDTTGAPLAGAAVDLRGAVIRRAMADVGGRSAFEGLPEGDYEVAISHQGFASSERRVRLRTGETVAVELMLTVKLLEETLVTAERTGERDVQATPMAVSVLTGDNLQRVQSHDVEDLAGRAPSVTFSQNTGFAQLTIRGIGTNAVFAGSDPSSSVYADGVYLARPALVLGEFLDLERVEVLRGPQGTLYGRNAVGGALNLVTRVPTNEVEATVRVTAGDFDTFRVEGRVSGPILRDRVMGSAAVLRGVRQGFVRDLRDPDRPLGGEDVWAARGKLRLVPDPRVDLLLSADLTHHDPAPLTYAKVLAVKPGFQVDNPADPLEVRTSTPAESRHRQYGGSARFTLQLARDTTLTSLTAFRWLDYRVVVDSDITELDLSVSDVHEMHHQASQEITLSRSRPRLTWIAGMFLFADDDRQPTSVRLGAPRLENRLVPDVETSSRALFGQATVSLTQRLSATAGLRYSREEKTMASEGALYPFDVPETPVAGSAYAFTDRISHGAWTPKAGIEMRVRESLFAYASSTRGFKSGGFNPTSQSAGLGFAPEWAWSHEAGVKTTAADGRVRLSAALFRTSYTDLQVQQAIRPGVIDISNAAEATISGIEVEGSGRLPRGLQVGGHLAWMDAVYDRYVAVGVGGVTADVAGRRLSNAPEWSGRLWVDYGASLGPSGLLSVRAESRFQSTVFFTPFNDGIQRQPALGLLDASVEWRPRAWCCTVGVFATNLTNETSITGTFSSPPPAIGGRPGEPRQIGVQLVVGR